MPSAGEMMSMRGMGMPRTRRGGGTRRVMMQRPVTPMLPPAASSDKGGALVANKSPRLRPLSERMASAYDKLYKDGKPPETDPLTQAALGKLVLEIQQTNASIAGIQQGLTLQSRQKKNVSNEEKKLLKKEEDNLVSVRGAFLDIRAKFGLFAGALAIKSLMEGRPGDAAVNAGAAVASFLPEIINIVSGAVIGKTLLGGKKGGVPAPRGRMAMPRGGGKLGLGLGLLGLAGVGVGMAQGNNADARRQELIKQDRSNPITPNDIKRFGALSNRFDAILSRMEANQSPKARKSVRPGEGADEKREKEKSLFQRFKEFIGLGGDTPPTGTRPRITDDADMSKAFRTGMVTGPEANIGMRPTPTGRNSYHVDTKFAKSLAMDDVINMMDQLSRGYEEQDRTIEFSNDAVRGRRYSTDLSHAEKVDLMRAAFAAHSHNLHSNMNSIDYYINKENEDRFGDSAKNVEILSPTLGGKKLRFGTASGMGGLVDLLDAQGNILSTTLHGDSTKLPRPIGSTVDIKPDPNLQSSVKPDSSVLRTSASVNMRDTGTLTIVPLPTGGEQPHQNQTLLTSTGPTPQTIKIDTRYPDKTRILQKLHVDGALV